MKIKIKDPVSAITHFIAMILALIAATPLLIKASSDGRLHLAALTVFIISMVFLYAASTIYHTLDISPKINRLLKKNRSYDDFHPDCRNVHANLPDRSGR